MYPKPKSNDKKNLQSNHKTKPNPKKQTKKIKEKKRKEHKFQDPTVSAWLLYGSEAC